MFLAGRGAGKTRSGAEWVRQSVKDGCSRIALIAPTAADARDIVVEGSSGLLASCWKGDKTSTGAHMGRPVYEPSKRRVTWAHGAIAITYSAEEPDRLRGPQHDALWADELASWYTKTNTDVGSAWDMAMFGLRIGNNPRAMVSTTPKPIPIIRELINNKNTIITKATTYSNRANLAGAFLEQIITKYEGTRLGRQELDGELLSESDKALWTRALIDQCRVESLPKDANTGKPIRLKRVVIAVDPAITAKAESNLTGIIAAGVGENDIGYVLGDSSGRYTPNEWANKACELYKSLGADAIVAEGNQGGDMVRQVIQNVLPTAPVRVVHASRGKFARAEPVASLYEQRKVKHVGLFKELEDQMCTWEPLGDMPSPDRLDALCWGITDLMVTAPVPAAWGVYGSHY